MRKVMTQSWIVPAGTVKSLKIENKEAVFHAFATESDDDNGTVKHMAVAIIEYPGGQVDTWPAHMIRFIDEQEVSGE